MTQKSEMEKKYEQYLEDDSRVLTIGDISYYRIIHKDVIYIRGGTLMVTVPIELYDSLSSNIVIDENDNMFSVGLPAHFSFRGKGIPAWYLETVTIAVDGINDTKHVGDYLAAYYGDKQLVQENQNNI